MTKIEELLKRIKDETIRIGNIPLPKNISEGATRLNETTRRLGLGGSGQEATTTRLGKSIGRGFINTTYGLANTLNEQAREMRRPIQPQLERLAPGISDRREPLVNPQLTISTLGLRPDLNQPIGVQRAEQIGELIGQEIPKMAVVNKLPNIPIPKSVERINNEVLRRGLTGIIEGGKYTATQPILSKGAGEDITLKSAGQFAIFDMAIDAAINIGLGKLGFSIGARDKFEKAIKRVYPDAPKTDLDFLYNVGSRIKQNDNTEALDYVLKEQSKKGKKATQNVIDKTLEALGYTSSKTTATNTADRYAKRILEDATVRPRQDLGVIEAQAPTPQPVVPQTPSTNIARQTVTPPQITEPPTIQTPDVPTTQQPAVTEAQSIEESKNKIRDMLGLPKKPAYEQEETAVLNNIPDTTPKKMPTPEEIRTRVEEQRQRLLTNKRYVDPNMKTGEALLEIAKTDVEILQVQRSIEKNRYNFKKGEKQYNRGIEEQQRKLFNELDVLKDRRAQLEDVSKGIYDMSRYDNRSIDEVKNVFDKQRQYIRDEKKRIDSIEERIGSKFINEEQYNKLNLLKRKLQMEERAVAKLYLYINERTTKDLPKKDISKQSNKEKLFNALNEPQESTKPKNPLNDLLTEYKEGESVFTTMLRVVNEMDNLKGRNTKVLYDLLVDKAEFEFKNLIEFFDKIGKTDKDKKFIRDAMLGNVEVKDNQINNAIRTWQQVAKALQVIDKRTKSGDLVTTREGYIPARDVYQILDLTPDYIGDLQVSKALASRPFLQRKTKLNNFGDATLGQSMLQRIKESIANLVGDINKDTKLSIDINKPDLLSQIDRIAEIENLKSVSKKTSKPSEVAEVLDTRNIRTKTEEPEVTTTEEPSVIKLKGTEVAKTDEVKVRKPGPELGLLSDTSAPNWAKEFAKIYSSKITNASAFVGGWTELGLEKEAGRVYKAMLYKPKFISETFNKYKQGQDVLNTIIEEANITDIDEKLDIERWYRQVLNKTNTYNNSNIMLAGLNDIANHYFRDKPVQDLVDVLKEYEWKDKTTRRWINDRLEEIFNVDNTSNALYNTLNFIRRFQTQGSIAFNISSIIAQPTEVLRLSTLVRPDVYLKAIANVTAGKKNQFDYFRGDIVEYIVGGERIPKNVIDKIIAGLESIGYYGIKKTEDYKNKVFIEAFTLEGMAKGLEGQELSDYVFDLYQRYSFDMGSLKSGGITENPIVRFFTMFQQYLFRTIDTVIRSSVDIGKGKNVYRNLGAIAGIMISNYAYNYIRNKVQKQTGDTVENTITGFVPGAYNPGIDAVYDFYLYMDEQALENDFNKNNIYGKDFDLETQKAMQKKNLYSSIAKNIPYMNQVYNKTYKGLMTIIDDEIQTKSGNVATPGPTTLIDKARTLMFGKYANTESYNRFTQNIPTLSAEDSAKYREIDDPKERRLFYLRQTADSKAFFESRDEMIDYIYNNDKEGLKRYELFNKLKGANDDYIDNPVSEFYNDITNASALRADPKLLMADTLLNKLKAEKTGKPLDPFYDLTLEQQNVVLNIKQTMPGNNEKEQLLDEHGEDWYYEYSADRQRFYDQLTEEGVDFNGKKDWVSFNEQLRTPEKIQELWDKYYELPKGYARKQFWAQNPILEEWTNYKESLLDSIRTKLGMPTLSDKKEDEGTGGYSRFGNRYGYDSQGRPLNARGVPSYLSDPELENVGDIPKVTGKTTSGGIKLKLSETKIPKEKQIKIKQPEKLKTIKLKKVEPKKVSLGKIRDRRQKISVPK